MSIPVCSGRQIVERIVGQLWRTASSHIYTKFSAAYRDLTLQYVSEVCEFDPGWHLLYAGHSYR